MCATGRLHSRKHREPSVRKHRGLIFIVKIKYLLVYGGTGVEAPYVRFLSRRFLDQCALDVRSMFHKFYIPRHAKFLPGMNMRRVCQERSAHTLNQQTTHPMACSLKIAPATPSITICNITCRFCEGAAPAGTGPRTSPHTNGKTARK
ncbi:hypothetical protein TNCV_277131 [Trichonephila clavipes]|uniref:Uncharacterized protein n=1 Tax=Trichonephila clavipes TaxID=2585209 RepID=A0A8X6S626_TRICX|nr:hypothetical protein TNCV_277131 [Trichonephila clavipes]